MMKRAIDYIRKSPVFIGVLLVAGLIASYAVSICWRVAGAELEIYKRNHIFKTLNHEAPDYTQAASAASYGGKTYRVVRHDREVVVHKQLINGFQHAYGSALAAYELGDGVSDFCFRIVEYFEAYTTRGGRTYEHLLDTKKDLHNNSVGRRIGIAARRQGLNGQAAEKFIQNEILVAIDRGEIIHHFMDPRVPNLPSLEAYGCRFLASPKPPESEK